MANESEGLHVSKPISSWNRDLEVDYASLFKALAGAVKSHFSGSPLGAGRSFVDLVKSFSLSKLKPEEVGWLLLHTAMSKAIALLTEEATMHGLLKSSKADSAAKQADQIEKALEGNKVTISGELFTQPEKSELLDAIRAPFKDWLVAFGIPEAQASRMAGRLSAYFVRELRREWRRQPSVYEVLRTSLKTPFDEAFDKELSWLEYVSMLEAEVQRPVFGEAFSLSQIYIPPRITFRRFVADSDDQSKEKEGIWDQSSKEQGEWERVAVKLEDYLREWVTSSRKDDSLKVISGGPGSGKSSFCSMFAAQYAAELMAEQNPVRTILIKLHHFDPKDNLPVAVGEYLSAKGELTWNPIEEDEKVLLLFDGLDELSQSGKSGEETARSFIQHLRITLERRNAHHLNLRAILTGREVVIQANEGQFRDEACELQLLPYLIDEEKVDEIRDEDQILEEDQRIMWWEKYGAAVGEDLSGMVEKLNSDSLRELTAQPLLNYLVALSKSQVNLSEETSLNAIYEGLIRQVYKRAYDPSGIHPSLRSYNLKEEQFFLVLEEIALTAWHGDGRKTTIGSIHKRLEGANLGVLLRKFEKGAEIGVTSLLTAFYFRQVDQLGDSAAAERTFEFTHKSFGEYLTARRLVRLAFRILGERQRNEAGLGEGWSIPDALVEWARISGPTRMDRYLQDFLIREVREREEQGKELNNLQECVTSLFNHTIKGGIPMERVDGNLCFLRQRTECNHAEEALLALLSAVARQNHETVALEWSEDEVYLMGNWLHRVCGQDRTETPVALLSLSQLNLKNCILVLQSLNGAILDGANLDGANLGGAILQGAILDGAILDGANLDGANLEGANLEGARLLRSRLVRSRLGGANLEGAILVRANLDGAILVRAILDGAILEEANLDGASLRGASLEGANLEGANLEGAILHGASLRGASLEGARLGSAILDGASLHGAILNGASLHGASLHGASLHEASLKRSQLSKEQLDLINGEPNWIPDKA